MTGTLKKESVIDGMPFFQPQRKEEKIGDNQWRVTVKPPAMVGGSGGYVNLTADQYKRYQVWRTGGGLIQNLLSDLSPANREILQSGIVDMQESKFGKAYNKAEKKFFKKLDHPKKIKEDGTDEEDIDDDKQPIKEGRAVDMVKLKEDYGLIPIKCDPEEHDDVEKIAKKYGGEYFGPSEAHKGVCVYHIPDTHIDAFKSDVKKTLGESVRFTGPSLNESFHWPRYKLKNGVLYNEEGKACFPNAPKFKDSNEAEDWLNRSLTGPLFFQIIKDQDERGNVQEHIVVKVKGVRFGKVVLESTMKNKTFAKSIRGLNEDKALGFTKAIQKKLNEKMLGAIIEDVKTVYATMASPVIGAYAAVKEDGVISIDDPSDDEEIEVNGQVVNTEAKKKKTKALAKGFHGKY